MKNLPPQNERRLFIKLLAAVVTVSAVERLFHSHSSWASSQNAKKEFAFSMFMNISESITGYPILNKILGQRIFTLMQNRDSALSYQLEVLHKILNEEINPIEIQLKLQNIDNNIKILFADILRAWQLGIVGTGKDAKVVSYEYALMYKPLDDVIVLPTYAHGEPHYWAYSPILKMSKRIIP